jgi:hypothetical protein
MSAAASMKVSLSGAIFVGGGLSCVVNAFSHLRAHADMRAKELSI